MIDFANLRVEDYLRMFWRRKWYAIITAIVITGGVVLYVRRLPNVYKSETTILMQTQGISEGYVKPTSSDPPEARLGVITQELQSRDLLESVIKDYGLYGYGTAGRTDTEGPVLRMKQDIEIKLLSGTTFSVAYYAPQAWLARDVLKHLAEEMIKSRASSREQQANSTDQFLEEQLRQAEQNLKAQEDRLNAFKTQHLGQLPEQSAANLSALNGLQNQLIANESALQRGQDQQLMLEQRLEDQKRLSLLSQEMTTKAGAREGPRGFPRTNPRAALQSQLDAKRNQLNELSSKYTDKFPDVVRLKREIAELERQISQIPVAVEGTEDASLGSSSNSSSPLAGEDDATSAIKSQLVVLKREIANRQREHEEILQQIQVYQSRLNLSPRVEEELMSITRDYDSLKGQYKSLQDKKFNARVTSNLEKSKMDEVFRILDEPYLPLRPVKPDRSQLYLMGLFAGISLGLGLVLGIEYLDPALRDEETASAELNLSVLISIPEIRKTEMVRTKPSSRNSLSIRSA